MTRSSTKELFTPFENPEREFHSSRKLFKTLSLDESSLPKFDLFSYLEEHSEEEIAHGRVHVQDPRTRSTETSNGSAAIQAQLNNLGREIKKINEKAYVAQNSKLIFEPRQATYPFPSHLYDGCYDEENGSYGLKDLDADSIGTILHNDALPQKEKDLGSFTLPCYINNVCFEKSLADLGASVSVMPLLTYLNLGLGELAYTKLTVELADRTVKHPKGIAENVLVGIGKFFPHRLHNSR
ncbi:retrovirus-related pol polyprotein from transposon TNT 1-94 [Tanacetum coccineum]